MNSTDKSPIVFVVLQYGAFRMTKKCVESVHKCMQGNYYILIVDNASPDDSLEQVKCAFDTDSRVVILESDVNLGFAKGNNIGIRYAMEKLHPEYIVMMNNDTELLQKDFQSKLELEYQKEHFDVLGPMILSGDGRYTSNPVRTEQWKKEEVQGLLDYDARYLGLMKYHFQGVYDKYRQWKYKGRKKKIDIEHTKRQINVELHGSFLVFSKDYLEKHIGLNDRTFMYCEEHILYQEIMNEGGKTVYTPDLMIYHAEDASTDERFPASRDKKKFYLKNHMESCKVLLDIVDKK